MPARNTADIVAPQFAELLNLFPCPAWIENSSGKIIACNDRKAMGASCSLIREQDAPTTLKTIAYPIPSVGNAKNLRLVARFPAARETTCQHGVISDLLVKIFQFRQPAASDVTRLTPREREIYRELARGCRYKETAERIGISHEVVRQLVLRIRRKLGDSCVPTLRRRK